MLSVCVSSDNSSVVHNVTVQHWPIACPENNWLQFRILGQHKNLCAKKSNTLQGL